MECYAKRCGTSAGDEVLQLIASIVFMYLVVGAAGYWSMRKRAELKQNENQRSEA